MRRDYKFHLCGTQEGISSKVDLTPCILTQYFLLRKVKTKPRYKWLTNIKYMTPKHSKERNGQYDQSLGKISINDNYT